MKRMFRGAIGGSKEKTEFTSNTWQDYNMSTTLISHVGQHSFWQGDIAKIQTKEKMIDQRTALVEQSKGMIKEAELDVTNKDALIAQLVKVNPRAANQYILEQLGVDPSLYAEDAAGLVDVIVNPPTKELGISN